MDAEHIQDMQRRLPGGQMIVDERCTCGRKRSEHGGATGHGGIEIEGGGTLCPQFTWKGWIFKGGSEGT